MTVLRVRVNGKFRSDDMINVLHYSGPDITSADYQEIVDGIAGVYSTHLLPSLSNDYTIASMTVYDLDLPETFGVDVPLTGGTITGGDGGGTLPPGAAVYVRFRYIGVKPNRGGIFLGGWSESAVGTGGGVDATAENAAAAFVTNLLGLTFSTAPPVGLVLYSRVLSTAGSPVVNPVEAFEVKPEWSGQTRRRFGRGG